MRSNRHLKRGRPLKTVGLSVLAFLIVLAALTSCARSIRAERVGLELVADASAPAGSYSEAIEQQSVVLRCSSVRVDGATLWVDTSKSKKMKVSALLFLFSPQDAEDFVRAVAAPVTGTEVEYDMTRAKTYSFARSSAEAVAAEYGIAYGIWQAGAISDSAVFPCCE